MVKYDQLILMVFRNKYNFDLCESEVIGAIFERAIWDKVHQETLRPCCASDVIG